MTTVQIIPDLLFNVDQYIHAIPRYSGLVIASPTDPTVSAFHDESIPAYLCAAASPATPRWRGNRLGDRLAGGAAWGAEGAAVCRQAAVGLGVGGRKDM